LSKGTDNEKKAKWEEQCLRFIKATDSNEVRGFFLRQLNLIGSDTALEAVRQYVNNEVICSDAVMALEAVGTVKAQELLASSLAAETCPCASQIMDVLAGKRYSPALKSYISWYEKGSPAERSAALYALSNSGDSESLPVLMKAAENAGYRWEPTGSVSALLLYARQTGLAGDVRTMEKITNLVISKSNTTETANQRLAAMSVIVAVKGEDALSLLLDAIDDPDIAIRGGVIRLASQMPGENATKKWINRYGKVRPEAKPEILFMLGERGDAMAVPLLHKALDDRSSDISAEAVSALAKIEGTRAVDPLLAWIMKYDSEEGHWAAANSLMTILDKTNIGKVAARLPASKGHSTVTLIWLLGWSGNQDYFKTIVPYCESDDIGVRAAALTALKNVAGYGDQETLIRMLEKTSERPEINELSNAITAAALRGSDLAGRSNVILAALDNGADRQKLIPVLAVTAGEKALERVAKEFEGGTAEIRDVCFDALSHWSNASAASALYDICASGNKTFERPAFDAYLMMVSSADITPERKILLLKKIAPLAMAPDARIEMLDLAGALEIQPAVFFVSGYLPDISEEVRKAAEQTMIALNLPGAEEYVSLFNGKDLSGWKGLVGDPVTRAAMKPSELAAHQKQADIRMTDNWSVRDGMICFSGAGANMCTVKDYDDIELYVDWRITKKGDSGIYLRGSPQVQIWDTSRTEVGAQVGSGGLYNNQLNPSKPLKVADNPVGEWNTFRILMTGEKVSVWLNGELVTDNVTLENYWNRTLPIFDKGPVELQAHGTDLVFRDIWIRELNRPEYDLTDEEKAEGFVSLFNGHNLDGWVGDKRTYRVEDGILMTVPDILKGGNIYTEKEYDDFIIRFDFLLSRDGNNGLGIRAPLSGDAAYVGYELQIIDNNATIYGKLKPYQFHGSVYGVIPAKKGFQKPLDEWNSEEVIVQGNRVKVILNGTVILDGDIAEASDKGTIDGEDHPGLKNRSGHIGLLYHTSLVKFRNLRIKGLD
ncbi:MAG TPA: DUF1080 domain-containing protein, partial [Bacteroidales bacterium]|nr:DUF1080 domain-containing protein [Bacteroidales bacterium]